MTRKTSLLIPIIAIILSGFLFAGESINAESLSEPQTVDNQESARSKNSGEKKDEVSLDESLRSGEEFSLLFFEGEKAFSQAQERFILFLTSPASTFDTRKWTAALDNINMGKGFGHLTLTLFIAALFIFIGLIIEWIVRRSTENLRRQILDTASLGRLKFMGRVFSRLFLNLLGFGIYMLTTFVLFAVFYDEGDPGFAIVSGTLLPSYYIRVFMLAANLVLSPAAPALRLFPLQDQDAKFLYRWTIAIVVTAIVIADVAYIFQGGGIGWESFLLMYSMSGLSVSFLVMMVIWRSRHRVSRAIWPNDSTRDKAEPSLRARIAKTWHWFAMLYVIGMGGFWFIRGLSGGEGAMLATIISVFLIPLLIGINRWAEHLLDIAAGLSTSSFISPDTASPESLGEPGAVPSEDFVDQKTDRASYLQQHLPLIKITLRILLVALLFFLIMRLWGIDLPLGRLFTSTALNILGMVLLGIVVWQFTKARIDRKIREEMPDDDEEMEEGGRGGSRVGTLLVLLRKFILSVLFVIVSLIILSSLGINIGPLIAGAGVIGLAIGFGSQTLVRDILSGVFFLIDDAFRVGDYIETAGIKGMVEHISLRSVKLRHPRGMVFTIPFGDMGAVQNFSRDYIITKLDFRVRYDTDVEKVRKAIKKKVYKKILENEELGPKLLAPIKSQGVRHLEDSAMIMRVKYKTAPGDQFEIRKEVYRLMQEAFKEEDIEFAHRNVTVYMPSETTQKAEKDSGNPEEKIKQAAAAAAIASTQTKDMKK